MEGIVERMRNAVEVKVQSQSRYEQGQNSFTISYEGKEPRTVMMVTNKLATMFIEENLKVRELQAEGTSEFLIKELSTMEDQLKRKEHEVRNFKERNMGQLPQQLDANLRILERLQQQLQTTSENMRAAEDRMIIIQNQIDSLKTRGSLLITRDSRGNLMSSPREGVGEQAPVDSLIIQLNNLKQELSTAQSKYTESHPDVIDLKRKIANLEPKVKDLIEKQKASEGERPKENQGMTLRGQLPIGQYDPSTERQLIQYTEQYNEALLEGKRLRNEAKNLKDQIDLYQKRIEDIPKREQELTILTRDYDLLKTNYQSLLDKKIQAQMAENLERKQQGEQFKILDPARVPEKPIKPDPMRIFLIGIFMGVASGLGLAWFRESLDQSFHSFQEVEVYLGIPVIATIPNLKEEKRSRYAA
jgi:polysaccharide chain length determinant protein (PEP-CTERM system associated)